MDMLINGLIWFSIFLLSTTLHEAAHAFAAMRLGDITAYRAGQVTLDPMPHIRREPVGMVIVPIISFIFNGGQWMLGWASAPYNPEWAQKYPKRAALMALAGPLANLFLMLVAVGGIHLGLYLGLFVEPESIRLAKVVWTASPGPANLLATFVSVLFSLNLVLFIFNLLPLPPLDGSGLFPFIIKEETALRIMNTFHEPGVNLVGLIVAWLLFDVVFDPVFLMAINLLYPGLSYQPTAV